MSTREPAPPSTLGLLAYPAVLIVVGLAVLFAVAGSDNLGQPLAGIITGAAVLAVVGGAGLLIGWLIDRRRH